MITSCLLDVEGLTRSYGGFRAVNNVSFTLSRGQILGWLGSNGAGKSTTMRMLAGVLAPDAGRITVNGIDLLDQPRHAKKCIGYLPENPPLYRELTVDEQLAFSARLHQINPSTRTQRIAEIKARCGLHDIGRQLIANLSKGYRQRVGIAQTILHNPDIIILDEPTIGLDPAQLQHICTLIRELGQDRSIILCTHLLAEVQAICSHVHIMRQGCLVHSGTLTDMARGRQSNRLRVGFGVPPTATELRNLPGIKQVTTLNEGRFRLHHTPGQPPTKQLIEQAGKNGWDLYELTPEHTHLEQIFIDLIVAQEQNT